jgi:hypothetical protein
MTSCKLFGAILILSTAFATPVFAQMAGLPELPGAYAFFSPNDDFGPAVHTVQPVGAGGVRLPPHPRRAHHIPSR